MYPYNAYGYNCLIVNLINCFGVFLALSTENSWWDRTHHSLYTCWTVFVLTQINSKTSLAGNFTRKQKIYPSLYNRHKCSMKSAKYSSWHLNFSHIHWFHSNVLYSTCFDMCSFFSISKWKLSEMKYALPPYQLLLSFQNIVYDYPKFYWVFWLMSILPHTQMNNLLKYPCKEQVAKFIENIYFGFKIQKKKLFESIYHLIKNKNCLPHKQTKYYC